MRILVLGSGAREYAIISALIHTGTPPEDVYCTPGNGGISGLVKSLQIDPEDTEAVSSWALKNNIDLVIVGPEGPLVAGVTDELHKRGISVFGPTKEAALLESSKSFAKQVMAAAGIPTGMARVCSTLSEVSEALYVFSSPYVVKADGLAAGKGVVVTHNVNHALEHAQKYVQAGTNVLVEEFLDGQEVSLFFLAEWSVVPLSPAQDFKRTFDNDEGPNTGGMGAYSPLPWLPEGFVKEVTETVALPTIREMNRIGMPFVGLLYCGLIVTTQGIRVIEFNARFGDPETQVVLRRLLTPLGPLLHKAATGQLAGVLEPEFSDDVAVTVVLASEGYPVTSAPERPITGIDEALEDEHIEIAHAATKQTDEGLVSTGGRVLSVIALNKTFHKARKHVYEAIKKIQLEGSHYRSDIALKVDEGDND